MTSPWIQHVRNYAEKNNVSYRDSMTLSRSSYKPMNGGDLKSAFRKAKNTTKTVARKTKNTANRASKFVDDNAHYVSYVDEDMGNHLNNMNTGLKGVSGAAGRAQEMAGGNFNFKNAVRKTKNTVDKSRVIARKVKNSTSKGLQYAAPVAAMLGHPEIAASMASASMGLNSISTGSGMNPYINGGSFFANGGSFKAKGGSFKAKGGSISNMCPHCGNMSSAMSGGNFKTNRPTPPKTLTDALKYN
jgi:hypothetical protein